MFLLIKWENNHKMIGLLKHLLNKAIQKKMRILEEILLMRVIYEVLEILV